MKKRVFGKTKEKLSIIGFGGILVMNESMEDVKRIVKKAIEKGINYFDVAPSYGDAEEKLGPALEPFRKNVFLACKTLERTKEGAWNELIRSLKRLRTKHIDLYQFHAITTNEDVEKIFAPNGAMEAFFKAKEEGLIRFIGFSAHDEESALKMMENFNFDTILFPLNWVSWLKTGFGKKVIEKAKQKNIGILAIKALAKRKLRENEEKKWEKSWYLPVETFEEASLALRFILSLPVTAAVTPGHEIFLDWACKIAENFKPLSNQEMELLKIRSSEIEEPIFPI